MRSTDQMQHEKLKQKWEKKKREVREKHQQYHRHGKTLIEETKGKPVWMFRVITHEDRFILIKESRLLAMGDDTCNYSSGIW